MSDAFMTAAVLMAATPVGAVSRITNISNQRVKESSRIAVMVAELTKLGVVARELPDGLEVEGAALDQLKPAVIDCHDDHRIAMAFAVLACRVPGLVIADKGCVAKTYPTFWDDLQRGLGVRLAVPEPEAQERARELRLGITHPTASVGGRPLEASVVLIGLRGVGKTTLGRAAAAALGRDFIVRPPVKTGWLMLTLTLVGNLGSFNATTPGHGRLLCGASRRAHRRLCGTRGLALLSLRRSGAAQGGKTRMGWE